MTPGRAVLLRHCSCNHMQHSYSKNRILQPASCATVERCEFRTGQDSLKPARFNDTLDTSTPTGTSLLYAALLKGELRCCTSTAKLSFQRCQDCPCMAAKSTPKSGCCSAALTDTQPDETPRHLQDGPPPSAWTAPQGLIREGVAFCAMFLLAMMAHDILLWVAKLQCSDKLLGTLTVDQEHHQLLQASVWLALYIKLICEQFMTSISSNSRAARAWGTICGFVSDARTDNWAPRTILVSKLRVALHGYK
eukprot:4419747-Amphidinium_carterae.2